MVTFGEDHGTVRTEIARYSKMRDYYKRNPLRIQANEKYLGIITVRLVELSESRAYPRRLNKLVGELIEFFGRGSKSI